MDIPKYALDENGKSYKLPDPPKDPVVLITEKVLDSLLLSMTLNPDRGYTVPIKMLAELFPDHFNVPRPVKEFKERMHHYYVTLSVPIGDPYLLQRCVVLALCDVLHYQGYNPFSVEFPDISCRVVSHGYKTVLVPDPTQSP